MNDLISRTKVIKWIKTECNPYGKPTLEYETSCRIIEYLERMPSAESVVQCKDCKHKPTGSGVNHDIIFPSQDYECPCRCEDFWYSWMPTDDWFCANGEKKEE